MAGLEAVDTPAGRDLHQTGAALVSLSFFSVSFFVRPEGRFFVPTRAGAGTPRAAAVKAGRRDTLAANSAATRPRLDGGEHGVRLPAVGTRTSAPSAS